MSRPRRKQIPHATSLELFKRAAHGVATAEALFPASESIIDFASELSRQTLDVAWLGKVARSEQGDATRRSVIAMLHATGIWEAVVVEGVVHSNYPGILKLPEQGQVAELQVTTDFSSYPNSTLMQICTAVVAEIGRRFATEVVTP